MPYPSAVEILAAYLAEETGQRSGKDLPADLGVVGVLPFHQVTRVNGADETPSIEVVQLDVDTYAGPDGDRSAADVAESEAEAVRDLVRFDLPGKHFPTLGAWISRTRTITGPREREYDANDTDIARMQAMYELVIRSTA